MSRTGTGDPRNPTGSRVTIRSHPIAAWVCTQCGQPFFETREVEQIERALEALDRANDQLAPAV